MEIKGNELEMSEAKPAGRAAAILLVFFAAAAAITTAGRAQEAGEDPTPLVEVPRTLSLKGDPERGRKVFYRCRSCHRLSAKAAQLLGPPLGRLFGRRAGSLPQYGRYSAALKLAGFAWTEEKLDAWLKDPNGFLPGNRMSFAGIRSPQDRRDLIAYLRSVQDGMDQDTAQ
ncbi:MAG: cytochrome c family protein [Alphaproteobacteria bacterium]|nr:MAG: cytochrome c family protein [Alphaproteobacteria bacterium]